MDNTGTDPRSRHRRGAMAAAAAIVALGALAVIGWQEHWPSAVFGSATPQALTWSATQAPLPADAARGASQDVILNDVACPNAHSGTWTPAVAPLPAGAAANQKWSQSQLTGLTSVACESVGSCVAAGSYTVRNGAIEGMIDTLSGGTWTAARAPIPAGAAVAKQYVYFNSATCPASGDCIAVGGYKAQNGSAQGLIETATFKRGL